MKAKEAPHLEDLGADVAVLGEQCRRRGTLGGVQHADDYGDVIGLDLVLPGGQRADEQTEVRPARLAAVRVLS